MSTMKVKVGTQGNPADTVTLEGGSRVGNVVPDMAGKSVFIIRNGSTVEEEIGADFPLMDGDELMVVANKRVGLAA